MWGMLTPPASYVRGWSRDSSRIPELQTELGGITKLPI